VGTARSAPLPTLHGRRCRSRGDQAVCRRAGQVRDYKQNLIPLRVGPRASQRIANIGANEKRLTCHASDSNIFMKSESSEFYRL